MIGRICIALLGLLVYSAVARNIIAAPRIYQEKLTPHWSEDGNTFWYRNDLPEGKRETIWIDARSGVRRLAFDSKRLAQALTNGGAGNVDAERLSIDELRSGSEDTFLFRFKKSWWRCDLNSYEVAKLEKAPPSSNDKAVPWKSQRNQGKSTIQLKNNSKANVQIVWLDFEGRRQHYAILKPGETRDQNTYVGHSWLAINDDEEIVAAFSATSPLCVAEIDDRNQFKMQPRPRTFFRSQRGDKSPNGRWRVMKRDHNLVLRSLDDGAEQPLSHDGEETNSFQQWEWSPDSKTLVAFRVQPGDDLETRLIESSPKEGGRAKLHTRRYALPGDKFPIYELYLFDVASGKSIRPEVETLDLFRPVVRWLPDGRHFIFEKHDRGHQRFRILKVDSHTGAANTVLDESTDTFLWTYSSRFGPLARYLEQSNEIIYASEKSGYRHLYLLNTDQKNKLLPITTGDWVVRGIDRIDEQRRQIWFQASGVYDNQDPYFIHYGRVNFDGSELVFFTRENGDHSVQFSPDRRFAVDTWSRVDQPPKHELRRTANGELICELEQADISELIADGWRSPEIFTAKGRDGKTDIWGNIYKPQNFDHAKSYPIIEAIYAGPHNSFVPKRFSSRLPYTSLTSKGFVVVKIDGMGTANRSKAFHDVCWQNLKDAGLPDRIAWIKAAAKTRPWMDLDRVGIYGGSAGGQNSTGALLFHGDFYKVAVSSCGCHDNRMDKAGWNEQWMGYPVGPHYAASSNIEHADRLRGKLMLIVGELDNNVPPESTMRLAAALIKAEKEFELVVIPGVGHGDGGKYGARKRTDFLIKHLQGKDPPDWNAKQR